MMWTGGGDGEMSRIWGKVKEVETGGRCGERWLEVGKCGAAVRWKSWGK